MFHIPGPLTWSWTRRPACTSSSAWPATARAPCRPSKQDFRWEYWPVIGEYWSRDLNTWLKLDNTHHVTWILTSDTLLVNHKSREYWVSNMFSWWYLFRLSPERERRWWLTETLQVIRDSRSKIHYKRVIPGLIFTVLLQFYHSSFMIKYRENSKH